MQTNKEQIFLYTLLFITLLTRYFFFTEYNVFFSDDDAGFALAVKDFNILKARPHLPGYIVYVKFAQFINQFIQDPFLTLKWLTITFSTITSGLIYKVLRNFFKEIDSFLLSLVILSNPLFWIYQTTPETYIYDLFFSSLFAFMYLKRMNFFVFPFIIAIMGGFRMSSAFFFIPVSVYVAYIYFKESRINTTKFILAFLLTIGLSLSWMIPLFKSVGGLEKYISMYETHDPMPEVGPIKNIVGFFAYGFSFLIPVYFLLLSLTLKKKQQMKWKFKVSNSNVFLLLWLIPGLIFFATVHYSKGYIFLIYIPLIIYVFKLFINNINTRGLVYSVIVIQTLFFIFYPFSKVNPQTIFRRPARDISLVQVWWDRLNAGYLHSHDRLRFYSDVTDSFRECVYYLDMNYDDFIIFDGKSSRMTINSMAFNFPEHKFATYKRVMNENKYLYQHGLEFELKNDIPKVLDKAFVLSSKQMYDEYLYRYSEVVYETDFHVLHKVKEGKIEEFLDFYFKVFI